MNTIFYILKKSKKFFYFFTFYFFVTFYFFETRYLSNPSFLLAAHPSSFLIQPLFPNAVRPPLLPSHSLYSTCVTNRMLCYAAPLVTRYFQPNPHLDRKRISLWMASILIMCLSAHIVSLIAAKRYYLVGSIYVLGFVIIHYISLSLVLNLLLSASYIFNCLPYPLDHTTF